MVANISAFNLARKRQVIGAGQSRRAFLGDYLVSCAAVGVIAGMLALRNHSVMHWFLVPVMACGILAGVDIVRWVRGQLDVFDPCTIIACLAFYGFFVAPVLHVVWNQYGVGNEMFLWGDWRIWLGAMASLNAAGLAVYRLTQGAAFQRTKLSMTRWEIQRKKFYPLSLLALTLSVAGVCAYLWQFDGIAGLINAFEKNQEAFVGKGWLLVLAWPLAVLSYLILVFISSDRRRKLRHPLVLGILLLSLFGMGHFALLGWYGSRAATIWALFWMLGIAHYWLRRLARKTMVLGAVSMLAFMYFYGFYKERGRLGFEILRAPALWLQPAGYERDLKFLLLGDLARADSNALILHNLVKDPGDYNYRWGLTYFGAVLILIPRNIWPDRPEIRVDAGSEAQLGKASPWRSSRLYGLSGEALLNFGPVGVPLLFALYGGVVGWYRRKLMSWEAGDARLLLAPFFNLIIGVALVCDSDVLMFFTISEASLISALIFSASHRFPGQHWINAGESITCS